MFQFYFFQQCPNLARSFFAVSQTECFPVCEQVTFELCLEIQLRRDTEHDTEMLGQHTDTQRYSPLTVGC